MARRGRPLESYVSSVMRLCMAGLTAYFALTVGHRAMPLESYVSSVLRFCMSGLSAYFALNTEYRYMLLFSVLFLIRGLQGRDFESARKWWISVVLSAGIATWLVWNLLSFDPPVPVRSESGIVLYGMTGCIVAEVALLISGRLRSSWKFVPQEAAGGDPGPKA